MKVGKIVNYVDDIDVRQDELTALVDYYADVSVHLPEWAYTKYEWYELLMMKQRLRKKIAALKKELSVGVVE